MVRFHTATIVPQEAIGSYIFARKVIADVGNPLEANDRLSQASFVKNFIRGDKTTP